MYYLGYIYAWSCDGNGMPFSVSIRDQILIGGGIILFLLSVNFLV